ncbi:PAS domain-containing protein [Rubellimicrobium aerolatum]|uniref:PAS domain-containing protein n=1 Tax=Rubellimicrobium aerolatum TaxID=490979 RepID=A0ABW0SEI7_9RHOB
MVLDAVRDGSGRLVDFVWRHANAAAARIVGRPVEAFLGHRLLEEIPGNRDAGLLDAYVRVVTTGEPWTHDFDYKHDGVDVYIRLVAAKVGNGFAVSFADLSERRQAARAGGKRGHAAPRARGRRAWGLEPYPRSGRRAAHAWGPTTSV